MDQSLDGDEGLELSRNVLGVEGHDISSLMRGVVGLEIRSSFSLGVGVGKNLLEYPCSSRYPSPHS